MPSTLRPAHRVFIWTIGCQMNRADGERIQRELRRAGHAHADTLADATAVVVNGCAVRDNADRKVWGMLGMLKGLKKTRPHLVVGLTGCTVHADEDELEPHLDPVDVLFDTLNAEPLLARLARSAPADAPAYEDIEAQPAAGAGAVSRFVNVIYGCDKRCTYCIVPFRRGAQRSRPVPEILDEVRRFRDEGAREIILLGQIVNAYGFDLDGTALPDVLHAVDAVEGIERIRFTTAHPRYMTRTLAEAMRDIPGVCEEINLPVQSGDDWILRRMARGYSSGFYRDTIAMLRATVPGVALTTDIIVGFCGERDVHFEESLQLVRDLRFDQVHVAAFSPRQGTVAAEWPDDVPPAEKLRRLHRIEREQTVIAEDINRTYLGTVPEVLFEELTPGKGGQDGPRWRGRTRTNKLVFTPDRPEIGTGDTRAVRITAATPWSLRGAAVADASA
ncbi:MAG: tRNA (N6-isopentenyl adenosine(37)-C2)-methylthiotransferase MiaB [Chloroflexi bacterium]|nr:tRNA (N6-isopentenyl adenosine(37)-C2)-methylthiotransferase MiaB [Chloroflexota bacterium]